MVRVRWWVCLLVACGADGSECPPVALEVDAACETTRDCAEEGATNLRCVQGLCRLPCADDRDCNVEAPPDCERAPPAVCKDRVCRPACPAAPCGPNEVCQGGRCLLGAEDFEPRDASNPGTLASYGWNQLPAELDNPTRRLATTGQPGCVPGDERCAGVAASGQWFALLGTQATTEKGSATLRPTCRACACCLECLVSPYADDGAGCPRREFSPAPLVCPADPPPTCASHCAACEACPAAAEPPGPGLAPCEVVAAARGCSACLSCEGGRCASCRSEMCAEPCMDRDAPGCRACERERCPICEPCRLCSTCDAARGCEAVDPGAAECRAQRAACDHLGAEGCYPTVARYDRSELSPAEQSLVSPAYDLSGVVGEVVLSFTHVPFGVGRGFFESRQGVPAAEWTRRDEEVVVELCGGGCEDAAAWRPAERLSGGPASIPGQGGRGLGLSLGRQSAVDWRTGRFEVRVPDDVRTEGFRFRFLPRLSSDARVGIDDIRWERR